MTVRAVVVPATPLLVPGASGEVQTLAEVRDAVLEALAGVGPAAPDGTRSWGVLADAPTTRHGALRASLAAAGIADRWVPALPAAPAGLPADAPAAGVAASVALWVVAAAGGPVAPAGATVVELAGAAGPAAVTAAVDGLAAVDVVVVAATGPDGPGSAVGAVLAVLQELARSGGWASRVVTVPVEGPHLPPSYPVTVWEGPRPGE